MPAMPISAAAIAIQLSLGKINFVVHAFFEAADDFIFVDEIERALANCEIIEDDADRERCLVLGRLPDGGPVHVVIDYGDWLADVDRHLSIITAYRPDPARWLDGRTRRR